MYTGHKHLRMGNGSIDTCECVIAYTTLEFFGSKSSQHRVKTILDHTTNSHELKYLPS